MHCYNIMRKNVNDLVIGADVVNGGGEGHDRVECAQRPDISCLIITGSYQQFAAVTPVGTRHRLTMAWASTYHTVAAQHSMFHYKEHHLMSSATLQYVCRLNCDNAIVLESSNAG